MAVHAASRLDANHHTFLQAVMKRGPFTERATMGIYKALVNPTGGVVNIRMVLQSFNLGEGFVPFLLAINQELGFVQMEVKKVTNQYDGNVFYGFVNTLANKEAKLGTQLTQVQILFFTAVVKAIAQDPTASGMIRSTAAMYMKIEPQGDNSTQDGNTQTQHGPIKMSMQAREDALALLVGDQLLSRTDDGGVALGVKAFLELGRVFRTLEVPFCGICNEAAIKAQLCRTEDCPQRAHVYCITRRFQSGNQRSKCPSCKTVWAQPDEEEFATQEEDYTEPIATQETAQASTLPTTTRKRRAQVSDDEEEEHVEANGHDAEVEVDHIRSNRRARSLGRGG